MNEERAVRARKAFHRPLEQAGILINKRQIGNFHYFQSVGKRFGIWWSRREELNTPSAEYNLAALTLSYTGQREVHFVKFQHFCNTISRAEVMSGASGHRRRSAGLQPALTAAEPPRSDGQRTS